MHCIRAELQGKRHGRKRGVQGHALLPFRAIKMRPGSVRPWVRDAGWMRGWDPGTLTCIVQLKILFAPP